MTDYRVTRCLERSNPPHMPDHRIAFATAGDGTTISILTPQNPQTGHSIPGAQLKECGFSFFSHPCYLHSPD